jgi:hypothetical protein
MFTALDRIDWAAQKGSIQRAYEEAWYWFSPTGGGGLYYPRMSGANRSRAMRKSLFWFRAEAHYFPRREKGEVVRRARQLANAMTDAGVEVRELYSDDPGELIWEDLKQVLARPAGPVPKAF